HARGRTAREEAPLGPGSNRGLDRGTGRSPKPSPKANKRKDPLVQNSEDPRADARADLSSLLDDVVGWASSIKRQFCADARADADNNLPDFPPVVAAWHTSTEPPVYDIIEDHTEIPIGVARVVQQLGKPPRYVGFIGDLFYTTDRAL